jgi:hypothetical protein
MADIKTDLERLRTCDPADEGVAQYHLAVRLAETVMELSRRVAELESALEHTRNVMFHPGEY